MIRKRTRINILMALNEIESDKELSEKLGMSQQLLSSKLKGNISMKTIELMADFFKVPMNEMFKQKIMKTPEEIAQWVIDNRYSKSEKEKVSDQEMYLTLVEEIKKQ